MILLVALSLKVYFVSTIYLITQQINRYPREERSLFVEKEK